MYECELACVCVCVTAKQPPWATHPRSFLKSMGGWELFRYPRKNRHPTSMLNLKMVCCLEVVSLCEIDSRVMGSNADYALKQKGHKEGISSTAL